MNPLQHRSEDLTVFAETNFRSQRRRFGIKVDDRRRHMYFIGKTGMGKSTALENMIISDIRAGRGVGVVDPHGELIDRVLDYIPDERLDDVVYFNPADLEWPIGFNILEGIDVTHKHLVASGLMSVFTKIWENVWSARMEYILNNCILALLDSPGNTLLGVNRLFVDAAYRKKIIANLKDPVVKSFWVDEYANYNDRLRTDAIAPIQNKVGQFLSSSIIRNIVGQSTSTIDMRKIMDEEKIILMDLSKGRIGEDNSSLLGAMMVTRIQLAAMTRVDMHESERKDFFLYVDEFQNFATESFASILSEARKYRLSLTLAHQYIAQLDELVQAAIFGNVGTIVSYRVGAADATVLALEFAPQFIEEDFVNLTKFDVYLKLMIDGIASQPFSASTLPPLSAAEKTRNREAVIARSRAQYARPRTGVEDMIAKWSGHEGLQEEKSEPLLVVSAAKSASPAPAARRVEEKRDTARENNESTPRRMPCTFCGTETIVHFEPEPGRPLYCKDCWKKKKAGQIDQMLLDAMKKSESEPSEGITLAQALQMSPPPGEKAEEKPKERPKQDAVRQEQGDRRRKRRNRRGGGPKNNKGEGGAAVLKEGSVVQFS